MYIKYPAWDLIHSRHAAGMVLCYHAVDLASPGKPALRAMKRCHGPQKCARYPSQLPFVDLVSFNESPVRFTEVPSNAVFMSPYSPGSYRR